MAKVIKGIIHFINNSSENFDSLISVKNKLTTLFVNLLNNKINRKNLFTNVDIINFYFDDGTESKIVINKIGFHQKNNKLPIRINNLSDLETPKIEIDKFNSNIYSRLLETWNLSTTYEEIEFLLYHINNMPPLLEIELVNTEKMLIHQFSKPKSKPVPPIFGGNIDDILKRLSDKEFDLNNEDSLGILREMISKLLDEDNLANRDKEVIISFYLELLGYATKSIYKQNNHFEFGKIVLCLKKIKQGFDFISNHNDFIRFTSFIKNCFNFEITNKDYQYYDLMEMVYYHEFGHLFFGHIKQNSKHISTPNTMQESYANFFASLIFDSQVKSLQILIKTKFQSIQYREPILIKVNRSLSQDSLSCKLSSLTLHTLIENERTDRQNNNGIHQ
jgi:hypothetical protein